MCGSFAPAVYLGLGFTVMSDETPGNGETWSDEDTSAFLEAADVFVPRRDEQVEVVLGLLPDVAASGLVVDLCCGDGTLARAVLGRFPHSCVLALDASQRMLDRARLQAGADAPRLQARLFQLEERHWRKHVPPAGAVMSSLAIHHLDDEAKRDLYVDVASMLVPGGVFVMADIVRPGSELGRRLAAAQWDFAVKSRSLAASGSLAGFERFQELRWNWFAHEEASPGDHPATVREHLDWLTEAGFAGADIHWMHAGHAIIAAHRRGSRR
jgi:tRNA (cmo5U34)-methyltransferase